MLHSLTSFHLHNCPTLLLLLFMGNPWRKGGVDFFFALVWKWMDKHYQPLSLFLSLLSPRGTPVTRHLSTHTQETDQSAFSHKNCLSCCVLYYHALLAQYTSQFPEYAIKPCQFLEFIGIAWHGAFKIHWKIARKKEEEGGNETSGANWSRTVKKRSAKKIEIISFHFIHQKKRFFSICKSNSPPPTSAAPNNIFFFHLSPFCDETNRPKRYQKLVRHEKKGVELAKLNPPLFFSLFLHHGISQMEKKGGEKKKSNGLSLFLLTWIIGIR